MQIKVYFQDRLEKPVQFFHTLKLFHANGASSLKKPVVSEQLDEFVFVDPTECTYELFARHPR